MNRKILLYISIAVLIGLGLTFYFIQQGTFIDERARVDQPIAEPVTDDGLEELDLLLAEVGWRVRDVTVGHHDGAIYAAVEGRSASIVRIVPRPVEWP